MTTIRARLSLRLLLSLIVVFALLWLATALTLNRITHEYIASRLTRDAEHILAALDLHDNAPRVLDESRLSADYQRIFSGHYYVVEAAGETHRSRSLWDHDVALPDVQGDARIDGPRNQRLLLLVHEYVKQGAPVRIAVAEDIGPILRDARAFNLLFGAAALISLIALVLLQRAGIKAALAPLDAVQGDIARLEYGKVKTLNEEVPGEVKPLVREVNRLLELLNERLRRSRNAIGNLAHALKGPLTELKHLVENSDQGRLLPMAADAQSATRQVAVIKDLIERELKRARVAGEGSPGAKFDPQTDLALLIETVQRHHAEKALKLDLRISSETRQPVDRDDMLELIGNLLDNACKWAIHNVSVTLANERGLTILIEDDGLGVRPEHLEILTKRGVRLDETTAGHGLGLAIARDIVEQYRGRLSFERSPALGGLLARIELPPPAKPGAA